MFNVKHQLKRHLLDLNHWKCRSQSLPLGQHFKRIQSSYYIYTKMKNLLLPIGIVSILLFSKPVMAQFYTTAGAEMIFSFATVSQNGNERDTKMRWSPVFNFGVHAHYDLNQSIGFFSGLKVRNIGFIYQDENNKKVIQRTYNLGIPVAIKIGKMDKFFVYGGYQFELPFHYKYKTWDSSDRSGAKTKFTNYFSDATPAVMHTIIGGIQFYKGVNIKFQWYLNNFINPDYTRNGVRINDGLDVQVFSLSLAANMFRGTRFIFIEVD